MIRPALLAALLLTGCGAGVERPINGTCESAFAFASYERRWFDCDDLDRNTALARELLTREGVLRGAEFDTLVAGLTVHTTEYPCVEPAESDGTECLGGYYAAGEVVLGANGSALLHELLHAVERRDALTFTHWHGGWNERGYMELDAEFRARYTPTFIR